MTAAPSPHTLLDSLDLALARFRDARVLVVGDVLIDRYLDGEVDRISPEAPVPVVRKTGERLVAGGAANVAAHVAAYGGRATLVGLVGADAAGRELAALLEAGGVTPALVADPSRPTTVKTRVLARGHQMLRVDEEATHAPPPAAADRLVAAISAALPEVDVVVLSDYAKGALRGGVAAEAIRLAKAAGKPVLVDPKSADFNLYAGADLISPNVKELSAAVGLSPKGDAAAAEACGLALERFDIGAILLTRSEQGMTLARRGHPPLHARAEARQVFDVTGAGDTVIATVATALAAGLDLADATRVGNAAAGVVVAKAGTAIVTPAELRRALGLEARHQPMSRDEARAFVQSARAAGKVVGFTNGVFDLLHAGHLQSLEAAARLCDVLVVGVNSDASVKRLKGPTRPVQDETTRARVIAALELCDAAILFSEDTPYDLIKALQPDVLFKGRDYTIDQVVGADIVMARGGRVELLALKPDTSTTLTIKKMSGG